ncbi:MAG: ATP-grasp domain-containing protein [Mesorhizobium sp.]|uniref:ATP-grasp domain-containing protein n=1 Tax=Mesorhizobium TaxID=68287 RepID=UPI000FD564EA|nr:MULTISPECIES: acetyl-CoA carboxylase biotin carboxylase subunit family protein [Mesorhizobium]RUV91709.1 ATP-grasp domain-containing protein [Mesorhizobium sp. M5C.F.Ca.IN.020.14.1.1]MCF6118836.1 acetyl-CoA carboxylase biotin carboxylase subunit family protein [Mesorhizobium muleiense]RWE93658.1 MAG: ATP-grasp domain-containing protein [Mesorhizobium sp.]RWL13106.1 MAG: ATP-grasp domain-containing protein [Mesorhizobium sp.]TIL85317.1 MAG: ATP-grasp domain-containing protein [Mesorhizobium 
MTRRALILLEGASNSLLYNEAARRLNLNPITLSADPSLFDYLAAVGIEAIRVDKDDVDALIRECFRLRSTYDIAGITSAQESVYAVVGKLCRYFGLPGPNPTAIERCCDKFVQRQLLAEAGLPIPAYHVAANAPEVERSAAEIGLPVILKPAVGIGSSGVRLCSNVDELTEHTIYLLGGKHIWRSSPSILVEEFAQGPQYNLEVMGNEVIGIAAADYGPPHFDCRGHIYPAPLTDEECKRISDLSLSCLRALGLGWGPSNIELRWTKQRGPVVIEVNPRLAGAPVPDMVQLAYGVDLITEHIKLVIGDECDLRKRHSHTAAARYLVPDRDGILNWIDGDSRAAGVSGVAEVKLYVEPKTPIIRKGDSGDRVAHVIAASPSHARTEAILQRAVDLIDWSITQFPTPSE